MIRADNDFDLDLLEPIPGKENIVAAEVSEIDDFLIFRVMFAWPEMLCAHMAYTILFPTSQGW